MQYNTQVPPPALFPFAPGNQFLLFNAETVKAGYYSQQVHIPAPAGTSQRGVRLIFDHSAAPGNFEYLIVEDDIDTAGASHYAQVPTGGDVTALNSGSATQATVDLLPFQGQFLSVYIKTAPSNSNIKLTVTATRI